ncbi:MAG: aminopeptidase [Vicinamibacterales bacterium]|nr:aminopeptidase [Vicinamibacterales bacterium]
MRRYLWILLVAAAVSGCAHKTAPQVTPLPPSAAASVETISELKAFEGVLGGQQTENFLRYSTRAMADERCYFTGKLELPKFYSGLRLVREEQSRCAARSDQFDVFFYPIQAVASGEETITVALAEAPAERVFVVVPHEDFHNQLETRKAPTEVAEAAATLVGFLTASDFARQRFGEKSTTFRLLERDADLFLRKSFIVNSYFEKVSDLYKSFSAGALTQEETLEKKKELFAELEQSCSAIMPDPVSFNKCPAAMNNAGLAFDQTYTRNYPILHDLYISLGKDTTTLVTTLKRLLPKWPASAAGAEDLKKME